MGEDVIGASQGVQLVMPGTAGIFAEAGMLMSMRQREVIADSEEHVAIGFARDEVVADVRELSTSPEIFGEMERRVFVLGHRPEGR